MADTVLVLEDDENLRLSLMDDLEQLCFTVLGAANADQAVQLAKRNLLSLLVTDVRMAGRNGIEALLAIRGQRKEHNQLPCIVITGFAEDAASLRALHSNIQAYLSKPFDLRTLYNTVTNCMNSVRSESELKASFGQILRWFKLDPASQEAKRQAQKEPWKLQVEETRRAIFTSFCSGLQMGRFLLTMTAIDSWMELWPLETAFRKWTSLDLGQVQKLAAAYDQVLSVLHKRTSQNMAGTGKVAADSPCSKEAILRLIGRVKKSLVTPEEVAYGWLLAEMPEPLRKQHPRLDQLHQLLWGERDIEEQRFREPAVLVKEALAQSFIPKG